MSFPTGKPPKFPLVFTPSWIFIDICHYCCVNLTQNLIANNIAKNYLELSCRTFMKHDWLSNYIGLVNFIAPEIIQSHYIETDGHNFRHYFFLPNSFIARKKLLYIRIGKLYRSDICFWEFSLGKNRWEFWSGSEFNVLSNLGISLGNPYDVCYLWTQSELHTMHLHTPIYYTPYTGITYSIYDTVASTAAAAVCGVSRS